MVVDIARIQSESNTVGVFVINDWIEPYMLHRLEPKCQVFLIKRKPGSKSIFPIIRLNYLLRKFHPDIIHSHSNQAIRCVRGLCNIPRVRTIHGLNNPTKEFPCYKALYAISDAVKEDAKKRGYESKTIYNGVNSTAIARKKRPAPLGKTLRCVQVGRLFHKIKGQDLVIKAIALLRDRGIFVQANFYGTGDSGEYLENLAKSLGIAELVLFKGNVPQSQIYKELCEYDLFLQPSREEGFGLTIVEALLANIPVLVSDIAAPKEVIKNGIYGSLFKNGDAEDLANKIETFINSGPDETQIEEACKFALANYDIRRTALQYLEEYKKYVR